MTRPCWVVLAPKQKALAAAADERTVVPGKGDYDAILEDEPGSQCCGEDEIAAQLSKKQPAYVLWLDEDMPRVQAFVKGKYAGEVRTWPDSVARFLKCTFPTCDGRRGKVDLTPHKSPDAKRGDQKIGQWTIAQWKHAMETSDWSVLIDGASTATCGQVLAALDDAKADVRLVAVKLASAISIYGEDKTFAQQALAKLRALASDKDKAVRAEAEDVADDLAETIERDAVRREFPWLLNFHAKLIPQGLAVLDDDRAAVRLEAYLWWGNARDMPAAMGKQITTKLAACAKREPDPQARVYAARAIGHVCGWLKRPRQ